MKTAGNKGAIMETSAQKLETVIRDLRKGVDEAGITGEHLDEAISHLEEAVNYIFRCMEEYVLEAEKTKPSRFASHVQMWNAEGIMMGRISSEEAENLVNSGEYHVINDQAIEAGGN